MKVVLVTIQHGRHDHLRRQLDAVRCATPPPAAHVTVSLDRSPPELPGCDVVHLPSAHPLPLSAARNLGIEQATRVHDADLVVCLDVDCLPSPGLFGRYASAAERQPRALLAGSVTYLPPGVPARGALPTDAERSGLAPHPARPAPPSGQLLDEPRLELFWSLSFAVRPATHRHIGGFDSGYVGYGGEDTDYARRAGQAGTRLVWVGGCEAYHQHHPVSSPPVEHLADIVRNARRFHARWGEWPMAGWLEAFRQRGLVDWEPDGAALTLLPAGAQHAA